MPAYYLIYMEMYVLGTNKLKMHTTGVPTLKKKKKKKNNNKVFEKWNNNGNIFLEIVGIQSDFKWHHLEYWKNNWLIK